MEVPTMLEIFAVGTVWFWLLVTAELALLFLFTEYENGFAATASIVAFLAALQFLGGVNVIGFALAKPHYLVPLVAPYLLLAVAWGIFKWRKLVKDRLRQHDELFAEFLRDCNLPPTTTLLPVEYRVAWKKKVDRTEDYKTGQTVADVPLAKQHKSRIVRWMALWPFSVALYFFKDMVTEIFLALYTRLATFLQRIADNIYAKANVKQNLEIPPTPPAEPHVDYQAQQ
jgi:hypothetical protein